MRLSSPAIVCRALLCVSALSGPASHHAAAKTPQSTPSLQSALDAIAQQAKSGVLGLSVVDLRTGATWGEQHTDTFPMMSSFKAPIAAAVLARVDAHTLALDTPVTISRSQVVPGSAVPSLGDNFRGEQMTVTVGQLLTASVSQSDNTAVDALLRLLGGPAVATTFLQSKGIRRMVIDADEGTVARVFNNLGNTTAPPPNETPQAKQGRLRAGYEHFLAHPQDTTTPAAAALFLRKLWAQQLLSPASTHLLLDLMSAQTTPSRLRGGLPAGLRLADKTGTSSTIEGRTAAYNDMGLIVWPDGHAAVVAMFLRNSSASKQRRS